MNNILYFNDPSSIYKGFSAHMFTIARLNRTYLTYSTNFNILKQRNSKIFVEVNSKVRTDKLTQLLDSITSKELSFLKNGSVFFLSISPNDSNLLKKNISLTYNVSQLNKFGLDVSYLPLDWRSRESQNTSVSYGEFDCRLKHPKKYCANHLIQHDVHVLGKQQGYGGDMYDT